MLRELRTSVLSADHVSAALTRLVAQLEDLELDCPQASDHILKFWVYALREELVPPAAIQDMRRLRIGGPRGMELAEEVKHLAADPLVTAEGLWADEVALMRQREFRNALAKAIIEYFDSGEKAEFARVLLTSTELEKAQRVEVPRKLISAAMDRSAVQCHNTVALLKYLVAAEHLRQGEVQTAVRQLQNRLPDISLDVPDAEPILNAFASELGF